MSNGQKWFRLFIQIIIIPLTLLSLYIIATKNQFLGFLLCGAWCAGDGLISILLYLDQSLYEHTSRIIRFLIGVALILFALLK